MLHLPKATAEAKKLSVGLLSNSLTGLLTKYSLNLKSIGVSSRGETLVTVKSSNDKYTFIAGNAWTSDVALVVRLYTHQTSGKYITEIRLERFAWGSEMAAVMYNWLIDIQCGLARKYNAQKWMPRLKEELMAATWHPRRVAAWLDAGVDVTDM